MPAREERVAGSLPGFGFPPPRKTGHPCGRMTGDSGVEPHVVEGVGNAPTGDTPSLAWGVIGGIAPGWTSAILQQTVMVSLCHGWCFSCLIDENLSRMELGFGNKCPREFYGQWRLMKFALNDCWTPRLTGKSHKSKEKIRG